MGFKKSVGEFFKPRNMFSRGARIGGGAIGAAVGGPQGAQMGYGLGDSLASTWEKGGEENEESGANDFFMRGKMPGGASGAGGMMNFFSRKQQPTGDLPGNAGIDFSTLLKLAQMSGRM